MMESAKLNDISNVVVGAAIEVHRLLGPGLLESAYEECLTWELEQKSLLVERQINVPLTYKGLTIGNGYRIDMLVEGELIVELKSVDALQPVHHAQLLTYLKLTGFRLGLLLNFKTDVMRNGIRRIVNKL